jgi:hypothetical protein
MNTVSWIISNALGTPLSSLGPLYLQQGLELPGHLTPLTCSTTVHFQRAGTVAIRWRVIEEGLGLRLKV